MTFLFDRRGRRPCLGRNPTVSSPAAPSSLARRIRRAFVILTGRGDPEVLRLLSQAQAFNLPDIGNPAKVYPVTLTEPEINAIHAASGFLEAFCRGSGMTNFWDHYGPTLEALSRRLAVFDD